MFLVDALLNATFYGGLLYMAVAAIIYAVGWTESRIKIERVQQTTASIKSHTLTAEQTTTSTKTHTVTKVEPESLVKAAETELVAA